MIPKCHTQRLEERKENVKYKSPEISVLSKFCITVRAVCPYY
jgi:hypothetical protein